MVKTCEKKAFSVIEIVVVMIVVTILAAVAMVKFGSYDTLKLDAAARKIASDIRYAQHCRMARQQIVWIDFDNTNNKYSLRREGCNGTYPLITDPFTKENLEVNFTSGEFQGINITNASFPYGASQSEDLGFNDSLGRPKSLTFGGSLCTTFPSMTGTGSVSISYKGRTKTIYVEVETGEVSIQ